MDRGGDAAQGQGLQAEVWLGILDPEMTFEQATAEAEAAGNTVLRCEEANPDTGEPRRLIVASGRFAHV